MLGLKPGFRDLKNFPRSHSKHENFNLQGSEQQRLNEYLIIGKFGLRLMAVKTVICLSSIVLDNFFAKTCA